MTAERPRIAVSRCLLGDQVRYNGGHSRSRFLTDELSRHVDWVPLCPEVEIGLGVPRPTLRLRTDGHLVERDGGADHTEAMDALAERRVRDLAGLDGCVLKSRSPSCTLFGVARHASGLPGERTDGQPVDRRGSGLFAARIAEAHRLLPLEEDGRLNDPGLREHFVERIFAMARLRTLLTADWSPRDLVAFHSRHKLQLLAHDPARYRLLGRVVAQAGTLTRDELAAQYRTLFCEAMAIRARRGRHANALLHLFAPLSDRLDDRRRHDLVTAIETYRNGEAPLSVPIALLHHHAIGEAHTYVAEQTYLAPFPTELSLRHHV